jgi:hypothetical protein
MRFGPILVFEAGLPNSNFLFLRGCGRLPPVARRLCQVSLEIPFSSHKFVVCLFFFLFF